MEFDPKQPRPAALRDAVAGWLAAERQSRAAGPTADAEGALRRVFALLPRPSVPAGFADRVMARVPWQQVAWKRRDRFAHGPRRLLVAAMLVLSAATLWVLPGPLAAALPRPSLAAALQGMILAICEWASGVAGLWVRLVEARRLTSLLVGTPQVLTSLLLCALLSAVALYCLNTLTVPRRSMRYVDPC